MAAFSDFELSVKFLNHASVLINMGPVRLVCDPWYAGTCFRGGWGLRFDNPEAHKDAARATHFWISHFHGDHLHFPTLKKLAEMNPDITGIANVSANFDTRPPLQKAGFKKIIAFDERRPLRLSPDVEVCRYPSTGIDNMLVVRAKGLTLLDFNDCNLTVRAIRKLVRRFGPVDVLMTNFNHANKLIQPPPCDRIKQDLIHRFQRIVEAIEPRHIIPFASMHYYKALVSWEQNDSMLTQDDLAKIESRVLPIRMGDEVIFSKGNAPSVVKLEPEIPPSPLEKKVHKENFQMDEVLRMGETYRKELKRQFLSIVGWMGSLKIWVEDLKRGVLFDPGRAVFADEFIRNDAHIVMHSESLRDWWEKPYGTDAFFVGSDFEIISQDTRALNRIILGGLFVENGFAFRQAIKLLLTFSGWRFFWNRREEILSVLISGRFVAGNRS